MQQHLHQGSIPYEIKLSEAAEHTRMMFQKTIDKGTDNAETMIDYIQSSVPDDIIANTRSLHFDTGKYGLLIDPGTGTGMQLLHRNAISQLGARTGGIMSARSVNALLDQDEWGKELLKESLIKIFQNIDTERILVRSVGDQVMAILSDRYMVINTLEVLASLLEAMKRVDAVIVGSYFSELKWWIRLAIPKVFEPVNNEVILYGLEISNSDFGRGPLCIKNFILRLWCTNLATMQVVMRKTHVGRAIPSDVRLAQDTIDANSRAIILTVRDLINDGLSNKRISETLLCIRRAYTENISVETELKKLQRGGLSKGEVQGVKTLYETTSNIEMLPTASDGDTRWRLSNAISLFAQGSKIVPGRREVLEATAGDILM